MAVYADDEILADAYFGGISGGASRYYTDLGPITVDGGRRWVELTGGMPTIIVRNLAVQRRDELAVLRRVPLARLRQEIDEEARLMPGLTRTDEAAACAAAAAAFASFTCF